ncbi:MAG: hypothetical protein WCJ64_27530 [Rhodospirillaceae bacterium]
MVVSSILQAVAFVKKSAPRYSIILAIGIVAGVLGIYKIDSSLFVNRYFAESAAHNREIANQKHESVVEMESLRKKISDLQAELALTVNDKRILTERVEAFKKDEIKRNDIVTAIGSGKEFKCLEKFVAGGALFDVNGGGVFGDGRVHQIISAAEYPGARAEITQDLFDIMKISGVAIKFSAHFQNGRCFINAQVVE